MKVKYQIIVVIGDEWRSEGFYDDFRLAFEYRDNLATKLFASLDSDDYDIFIVEHQLR